LQRRMQEDVYREAFDLGREEGLANLRQWQLEAAQDKDRIMLIWLGKQYLGQRDNVEVTGAGGKDLSIQVEFKAPLDAGACETTLAEVISDVLLDQSFKLLPPGEEE